MTACPASASGSIWFPDPAPAYGAESYFVEHKDFGAFSGSIYQCEFECTLDKLATAAFAYGSTLIDMGFEYGYIEHDTAFYYDLFSFGGYTAEIFIELADNFDENLYDDIDPFVLTFLVPDAFDFELGLGLNNVIDGKVLCSDCEGSGKCAHCWGGKSNYGAGYVDCVICDGFGYCTLCDGLGYHE